MSMKPISPRLADRFCLLAVSQLQTQMSRSGALDTSALAVVSACAAIAAIVLGVRSAHHLAGKDRLLARAVTLLVLAIVLELAGVQ